MKTAQTVGWWLVVVGALNWGLVGLGNMLGGANWNVVQMLLGAAGLADTVYVLVGLSGLWLLWAKLGK